MWGKLSQIPRSLEITMFRNCPQVVATQNLATVFSIRVINITKIFPTVFDSFSSDIDK